MQRIYNFYLGKFAIDNYLLVAGNFLIARFYLREKEFLIDLVMNFFKESEVK